MRCVPLLVTIAALAAACGVGEPVSRELGARCDLATECDERCLVGGSYPGGFCSLACDNGVMCPGDSLCVEEAGGVCLFACEANADCGFLGSGWRCVERGLHPGTPAKGKVCRGS